MAQVLTKVNELFLTLLIEDERWVFSEKVPKFMWSSTHAIMSIVLIWLNFFIWVKFSEMVVKEMLFIFQNFEVVLYQYVKLVSFT